VTSRLHRLRTAAALAVIPALAAVSLPAAGASAAAAGYDGYHRFAAVERQLQDWAKSHPELKLLAIGTSAGGRTLYVARLAAPGGVDPDQRPAVFVGANVAGYHNAGTEAALHLIGRLLAGGREVAGLLADHTFYVAPALDPDAHDGLFERPRQRRGGNAQEVDHDRDGLIGEDPPDDLDGDGVITQLRIPDPTGGWLPDPADPRLLVKADALAGRTGAYRVVVEGKDDDGDGAYNEDAKDGVQVDRNFPHAFPYPDPEAGPWSSYAPEAKALMDFLLARRNVALAVVYGPANNLLAAPQSLGGGGDLGTQTFKIPERRAQFLGLDPNAEYTIDQVWEVVKDLPFARQNNITKDQLAQFLGAGAATKVDADDQAYLDKFAAAYKERLKKAGLGDDRPAAQYGRGGFTPWLYYQYGAMALELDVWGIPKAAKAVDGAAGATGASLSLDRLAAMSPEEFLALGEEKIAALLKENKVPPAFDAAHVMAAVKGGQLDPKGMVARLRQMGGGAASAAAAGGKADGGERQREVLAWVDAHAPWAFRPWTPVTLPDGTRGEAGGLDPFIETTPPRELLEPALEVHTATVLDLAAKLPRLELLSLDADDLGGGVWRVRAVAGNRGVLATHTKMAERARCHLPVRLEIQTGGGVELVTGHRSVAAERLEGATGTLRGEWLVRAGRGASVTVEAVSDNAGRASKTLVIGKGDRP
jgi:zinc carboxypeptidase